MPLLNTDCCGTRRLCALYPFRCLWHDFLGVHVLCILWLLSLLWLVAGGQPAHAGSPEDHRPGRKPVASGWSEPRFSLLHDACASSPEMTPPESPSLLCATRVATATGETAPATLQTPALEWKAIEDTEHLYPTLAVSYGISWFSRFDEEISTYNVPLVGATGFVRGPLDVSGTVGLGINGLYGMATAETVLYYKYPNFWSLDAFIGTVSNLEFNGDNAAFWGGGLIWHLEFGVFRFSINVGIGAVGRYCRRSFICEVGPGGMTSLVVTFIKETTGIPPQR